MVVNYLKTSILVIIILLTNSCVNSSNGVYKKDNHHTSISTLHQSNHYIYYMPKDSIVEGILIVMDPHAKPSLILDSLHNIADKNHLALLGLKEIKNGISNYNNIIRRDLQHFISFKHLENKHLYIIGFSGAARMAFIYSKQNRIDGLIACGAGIRRQTQLPYPLVLISGMSDFNFMEQYYSPSDPRTLERNIIAIHFKGKHQWPPINIINKGIDFILVRNYGNSENQSKYYANLSEKYYANKDYFQSFKSMEVAYKLSGNTNSKAMRDKLISLSNDYNVKLYFQRQNKYISDEQKRYQMLAGSLESNDLQWWHNQIKFIESKSESENPLEAASYSRTKAYIGILMYSRINAISAGRGNYSLFSKYLSIYEIAEPQNPDLFFFKAIYSYTQGQQDIALVNLNKAIELGFTDTAKMRKLFSQDFLNKLNVR